ncbi:hypothetical protein ACFQLX_11825 [Streptomyces polyrhachis]|uniref:DUF4760 domain-containing protein n=1 Tax=Streptomyces polyrhachis TaxID=1282885 RepID=A0ABW2GHI3_9ACTN
MEWAQNAQAWAAIGSSAMSLVGLGFLIVQLRHLVENLHSTARRSTYEVGIRLKEVFIEHPHLRPYFFENAEAPPEHPERHRIAAVAELYCIYMQEISSQQRNVSPANRAAWKALLTSIYTSSPAVRHQLATHHGWYSQELTAALHEIRAAVPTPPAPAPLST